MAGELRRVVPIVGGTYTGRGFNARVLPGGADFQRVVSETVARLVRGEAVDPRDVYFRCVPRFECAAPALAWIGERVFVGTGVRRQAAVQMRFFELM